jgi:hypothetical protein
MWHNPLDNPSMIPLDDSPSAQRIPPCSRVPLTYLESLLCVWCDPCPLWSQVACKLTSPPFPPHSLSRSPTVPHFNYVPFYDNITTSTSYSLIQSHCRHDGLVTVRDKARLRRGHKYQSRQSHQGSKTTLTGESQFHLSTPLGIEPGSLMTGSKWVDQWNCV